jgi:hypothetical protein
VGRLAPIVPVDQIILGGALLSASGGVLQLLLGLGVFGTVTPLLVLIAFSVSNFGTGLMLAACYAQAFNTVAPSYAGAASALSGFLHMGWAFLLTLGVASVAHTSSLQFGIAQFLTTGLSLTTALLLVLVLKKSRG